MNPSAAASAALFLGLAWAWSVWRAYWLGYDHADRAADARLGRILGRPGAARDARTPLRIFAPRDRQNHQTPNEGDRP